MPDVSPPAQYPMPKSAHGDPVAAPIYLDYQDVDVTPSIRVRIRNGEAEVLNTGGPITQAAMDAIRRGIELATGHLEKLTIEPDAKDLYEATVRVTKETEQRARDTAAERQRAGEPEITAQPRPGEAMHVPPTSAAAPQGA
jgi:hypothetical protein